MIPNGAQTVIDARLKGFKPADMLIVSLIGQTGESNHTIYANERADYDWRWMRGLKACVYVNGSTDWKRVLLAIAKQSPAWLGIYHVDQFKGATVQYLPRPQSIDLPADQWRWKLDLLPWTAWQNNEFAWGE